MAVLLYHYTSAAGHNGIKQTDNVLPSSGRGARHGPGVYLTSKHPLKHTEMDIAENNFDGAWKHEGRINKVQLALEFQFSAGEVRKLYLRRGADVWLYQDTLQLDGHFTECVFYRHLGGYRKITGRVTIEQRTPSDARRDLNEHMRLQMQTLQSATSDVVRDDAKEDPGDTTSDALRDDVKDTGDGQILQKTTSDVLRDGVKQGPGDEQILPSTTSDVLCDDVNQSPGLEHTPKSIAAAVWQSDEILQSTPSDILLRNVNVKQDSGRKRTLQATASDVLGVIVKERRVQPTSESPYAFDW